MYRGESKGFCGICGQLKELVMHHIQYPYSKRECVPYKNGRLVRYIDGQDAITIYVCRSCHMKIHKTNKYPKLKPKINRLDARDLSELINTYPIHNWKKAKTKYKIRGRTITYEYNDLPCHLVIQSE